MKKKSTIIAYILFLLQISILGSSLFTGWVTMENWPLIISALIFIVGLTGGALIKRVSEKEKKTKGIYSCLIIIVGSFFASIGTYIAFIPGWLIVTHSTPSAILLLLGFIAPGTMYKY